MAINSKRKSLFMTLLLTLLLVSSAYAALTPNVQAAEMTAQQKGLAVLSNVVGVDLTKYDVTTEENSQYLPYLGAVLQETVLYKLTSGNSKLKALYIFANGNLQEMYVLEKEGTPSLTKPAVSVNAVENAHDFLSDYQAYTAKPVFGQLISTLNGIDASKNQTKTVGDKVLEVTALGDRSHFKWYYTANGAIAPYSKFVAIGFKDGFLTSFIDNWNLYSIGSSSVNLSKEEAVAIALDTARKHSWSMQLDEDNLDPRNFNEKRSVSWTALVFDGSLDANKTRSEDVLELYPVWRVGLVLNRVYGELYGIEVDIWADTKEVRSVEEEYSQLAAQWFEDSTANVDASAEAANQTLQEIPTSSSAAIVTSNGLTSQTLANGTERNFAMGTVLPAITVSIIGVFVVGLLRKKHTRALCQLKPRSVKTCGMTLGFLILLVVFLPLVATANATTRAGVIWAARSSGAPNENENYHSWRKTNEEITQQYNTSWYIKNNCFTAANGYDGFNYYWSQKSSILYQSEYVNNWDYVAVVDFDHGNAGLPGLAGYPNVASDEWHYMFEDDYGTVVGSPTNHHYEWNHGVYDIDMYNAFLPAQVHFAFIDTCQSANIFSFGGQGFHPVSGEPLGLPFAFTHRPVAYFPTGTQMSIDGYSNPDPFPQCYIGFPYGSAALDQKIPYPDGTNKWYIWVGNFFNLALNYDISVKDALDMASNLQWGCYGFLNSPLRGDGFTAVWPMDLVAPWGDFEVGANQTGPHSTLAVYGNSNIHLKNFQPPDYVTAPSISGPTIGDVGVPIDFSAHAIDSHGHNIRYVFDWGDGSQNVTGYYPNDMLVTRSHTWNSAGIFNVKVQAQCESGVWSSWSESITINLENEHWLTVDAYDYYIGYPFAPLYPDIYIDGNYAGTGYVHIQVADGYHSVTVDEWVWNQWWYCYSPLYCFSDGYGNGDYRPIYSDTTITAWYYA